MRINVQIVYIIAKYHELVYIISYTQCLWVDSRYPVVITDHLNNQVNISQKATIYTIAWSCYVCEVFQSKFISYQQMYLPFHVRS